MVAAAGVFRHRDGVKHAIRAAIAVDHRRRGNADFRRDVLTTPVVARCFATADQRDFPELREGIGVVRVDAVVFRDDVDHVVRCTANRLSGDEERLSVDLAIGGQERDFTEAGRIDVGGCECRLGKHLTGAGEIVVMHQYIGGVRDR